MFFFLSIVIGLGIGLFYGWVIQPIRYTDTPLKSLGSDYQTDYVLMVAEAYSFDHNLAAATHSLEDLGSAPGHEIIHQAILRAEKAGYDSRDLNLMRSLQSALIPQTPTGALTP
jgi:hypothetical protein